MNSSPQASIVGRTGAREVQVHGAALVLVALLALWLGAHRMLDRTSQPEPRVGEHRVAQRL